MTLDSHMYMTPSTICSVVDDSAIFHIPSPLYRFFELELSTFQDGLRVPDADCKNLQLWSSYRTTGEDMDTLSALPDDMIYEILKRLRCSDIRSLRTVSRSWKQGFPNIMHQFLGCSQLPNRKPLWISSLRTKNGIAFLSNDPCNRRKLYGKVLRFPGGNIFYEETTMVASDAGLICIKADVVGPRADLPQEVAHFGPSTTVVSDSNAKYKLIVWNPVLMDFRILPPAGNMLQDPEAMSMTHSNFGLMVDSHSKSYKVIVTSPDVGVQVFESGSGVWKSGSAPPAGTLFSGEKNPVTHRGYMYFVAYQRNELPGSSFGKRWFIMRYCTQTDTWRRMSDIPKVHQINSWRICEHFALPDLVGMLDGVVLVAENDHHTNKHIFRFNQTTRMWDLIFHVPIFSRYITSLGPVKCIGTQMNLFLLLSNSLPFLEVDLGAKQWAWCLPAGLHSEHELKRFSELVDVKETLPFEPSLYPASEPL